jgi:hypothetical protein
MCYSQWRNWCYLDVILILLLGFTQVCLVELGRFIFSVCV